MTITFHDSIEQTHPAKQRLWDLMVGMYPVVEMSHMMCPQMQTWTLSGYGLTTTDKNKINYMIFMLGLNGSVTVEW